MKCCLVLELDTKMTTRPTLKGIKNKYFKNWANTYSCRPELYFEPESIEELRDVLALAQAAGKKVRVVGVGHSPSSIACTPDYMISLKKFDKLIDVKHSAFSIAFRLH